MADNLAETQNSEANPRFPSAEVPKILLLEDSPGEAELFRMALGFAWEARQPYSKIARPDIEAHHTAHAALESLRQTRDPKQGSVPDLVVLDLDLPCGTSLAFLRELRQDSRFAQLPVIVMAWSDEPSTVRSLDELGIMTCIIKPMRFDDLVTVVGDFCRQIFPEVTRHDPCAVDRRRDA